MKLGNPRTFFFLSIFFALLCPDLLVTVAHAQTKSFRDQLVDSRGIFMAPFASMVIGGCTLISYNSIAIRRKAFINEAGGAAIILELQSLYIEGMKALGV